MNEPYSEGRHAAKAGYSADENPYVSHSRAWHLWSEGYYSVYEYIPDYFLEDEANPWYDDDRPY